MYVSSKYGGAERTAYDTMVQAGPRSAFNLARPTDRIVEPGDLVMTDIGARYRGYVADGGRGFTYGKAIPEKMAIVAAAARAVEAGLEAARPGIEARALNAVIQQALVKSGYCPVSEIASRSLWSLIPCLGMVIRRRTCCGERQVGLSLATTSAMFLSDAFDAARSREPRRSGRISSYGRPMASTTARLPMLSVSPGKPRGRGASGLQSIIWKGSTTSRGVVLRARSTTTRSEAGERNALEHARHGQSIGDFGLLRASHLEGFLAATASHRDVQAFERSTVRREGARHRRIVS